MGALIAKISPQSALSEVFPPKSNFIPERDIPDLTGKVIIVTGGNSGIGLETAKQLLLKNAKVYLAGRDGGKCEAAAKKLKEETKGKEPVILQLDLADLVSVRKAAEEFLEKEERLDVLFNNAGVMIPPRNKLTAQGYDLQFGTNVLGHYFFTILLMPALERSTAHYGTKARVINTSSNGAALTPGTTGLEFKTVKGGEERDKTIDTLGFWILKDWTLYGASKLGNIMFTHILIRYYGDKVASCSLNPGGIKTELQQHIRTPIRQIMQMGLYPTKYGALTQLWGGTTATEEEMNGKHLIPWGRIGKGYPRAKNEKTQDELKAWLEEQVKDF